MTLDSGTDWSLLCLICCSKLQQCIPYHGQLPFLTVADLFVCRDLTKRVCVAGGNPMLVESPAEPKWSPKGVIFQLNLHIFLVIFLETCQNAFLSVIASFSIVSEVPFLNKVKQIFVERGQEIEYCELDKHLRILLHTLFGCASPWFNTIFYLMMEL